MVHAYKRIDYWEWFRCTSMNRTQFWRNFVILNELKAFLDQIWYLGMSSLHFYFLRPLYHQMSNWQHFIFSYFLIIFVTDSIFFYLISNDGISKCIIQISNWGAFACNLIRLKSLRFMLRPYGHKVGGEFIFS